MRPEFGFDKLPVDLRQTPADFIQLPDCDYVFLTQKIDKNVNVSERILKILDSLDQLERTYKAKKVITEEEELRSRLDLRFDFDMFSSFLDTWYECLEGDLGD